MPFASQLPLLHPSLAVDLAVVVVLEVAQVVDLVVEEDLEVVQAVDLVAAEDLEVELEERSVKQ